MRLCLFLVFLLTASPLAAAPVVRESFEQDAASLVIAWDGPIEVQRRSGARGFLLEVSRPLPDLEAAAARLPEALGRLKALDARRLQLVPAAGVAVRVRVEEARRLVIAFLREDAGDAHGLPSMHEGAEPDRRASTPASATHEPRAVHEDPTASPPRIDRLAMSAQAVTGGLDLRFAWGQAVPAAAFVRGGELWVAFGGLAGSIQADRTGFAAAAKGLIRGVRQHPADGAMLLRFTLERPLQGRMTPENDGWTLTLRPTATPPTAAALRRAPGKEGLTLAGAEGHTTFVDPDVGDRLHVVMFQAGARAVPSGEFVDFEVLPALQGGVLRPKVDRLKVVTQDGSAWVSRPGGLRLGRDSGSAVQMAREPTGAVSPATFRTRPAPLGPLFGFKGMGARAEPLDAQIRTVMRALKRDTAEGRPRRWRDLARLHLARDLPEEAQALLGDDETPEAAALRATALLLMDRPDAAADALRPLAGTVDPELDLWQGLLAARQERWEDAHALLNEALPVIATYPPPLRFEALDAAVRAALGVNETGRAFDLIRGMKALPLDAEDEVERKLLEAAAQAQEGADETALALLREASGSAPLAQRARARALLAGALLKAGAIDAAGAADLMSEEAVLWHGLKQEARLLERLADYEAEAGRYGQALARLERVRTLLPDEVGRLDTTMRATLLAALEPDGLPPLEQLLALRRHGNLLADQPDAPDVIRALSRRLARAGFKTAAEELARLGGEGVAKPEESAVARYEALLRDRRVAEAHRVLEGMSAADLERAVPAAFLAQDWQGVLRAAGPLVRAIHPGKAPDAFDRLLVLRLAVALAREKNGAEIRRLTERFGWILEASNDADLLALLADRTVP